MEVKTLNIDDFHDVCNALSSKIDFQPNLLIGVLNGGGFVLNSFKKDQRFSAIPSKLVKLTRGNIFRNFYAFQILLKWLPYALLNKLRVFESRKAKRSIEQLDLKNIDLDLSDVCFDDLPKKDVKNILILDDAIDTGRTMYIISKKLKTVFPQAKIKVAVISWTIDSSIVEPNYYIFKNILVRFPWSNDYKGEQIGKQSLGC